MSRTAAIKVGVTIKEVLEIVIAGKGNKYKENLII